MSDDDLLGMGPIVGLHALPPEELHDVERHVVDADPDIQRQFHESVRDTREVMASMSAATAVAPPAALRDRILAAAHAEATWIRSEPPTGTVRPAVTDDDTVGDAMSGATVHQLKRRRVTILASIAAGVLAIAIGGVGWIIGANSGPSTETPTADKVFAAPDVRTSTGSVASGTATVTYSHSTGAGVLVMNDVPPPQPGTVYQMWLTTPEGMTSAGTMSDKDVAPSTTAVIKGVDDASALSFTVEPPGGSPQPTSPVVASLSLR